MVSFHFVLYKFLFIMLFNLSKSSAQLHTNNFTVMPMELSFTSLILEKNQETQDFQDETTVEALKYIAYYLRNYKFNEWDRRRFQLEPKNSLIGFFVNFPIPPLETLHWEVYENCDYSFIKCITYLQTVIRPSFDACVISNGTITEIESGNYLKGDLDENSMPFYSSVEKFQWKTTASYYMCWYTMLGIPALSMLGGQCDNFADSLDYTDKSHNFDPRSNNKLSFSCAIYSFCPDPCCPKKLINSNNECKEDKINPCYIENKYRYLDSVCKMDRKDNQNLNGIMENKWNVSCTCKENGFAWSSKYGMCVDVNECMKEEHNCDVFSETCLNSPGSYYCICKSGFSFNNTTKKCMKTKLFL